MGGIFSTNGDICSILLVERTIKRKAVVGGRKILKLIQRMVVFVLSSFLSLLRGLLRLKLSIKFLREIFYAESLLHLIVRNVVILWVNTNFTIKGESFVESFYYLSFTAQQKSCMAR